MSKQKSIYIRLIFFLITLALVALVAVAVVSAAQGEGAPLQAPAPSIGEELPATRPLPNRAPSDDAPLAPSDQADPTTLELAIVSTPYALLDQIAPGTAGPHAFVVEAAIRNTGPTTATGLIVTLDYNEDPVNNWTLLPGEDPVRIVGDLAQDETYHAYWFATYNRTIGTSHRYTVTAEAENAFAETSQNYFLPTGDTVQTTDAQRVGVTRLQTANTEIVVGVAFTTTVVWKIGSPARDLVLSPVGNVDFDPASYRLVASKVTLSDGTNPTGVVYDRLFLPTLPSGTTHAQGDFVFLALRALPTNICPYAGPRQPNQFKYDNEFCTPRVPISATVSLSLTKQVNASEVQQGQALTYTLTYTNNGNKELGNVWIWDDIDPGIGAIVPGSIDPPSDPGTTTDHRVAWFLATVAESDKPGSTGVFTFTILVDGGGEDLVDQTPIVNHAFFGIGPGGLPANPALTSTMTSTVQAPTIAVAKTDGLDTVNAGEPLIYTLLITNSGSVTATNVVVSDLLPSGVIYTGATSWTPDPIPPNGGTWTVDIPVTVAPLLPDGSILTNIMTATYKNEADWTFDPENATDTTTVEAPFWVLTKSASPDPVVAGRTLTYTLSYFHNGLTMAQDVSITDTLSADVTYGGQVSQTATWDEPVYDPGPPATLTWYTPTLTAGTSGTMVFTVTVNSDANGLITNNAVITSTTPATHTIASEDTTVETEADLQITKSDDPDPVIAGTALTYSVQVTNNGPSDASGVTATDTLPTDVTFDSYSATQGTFDDATGVWSVGNLADGASATLTLFVTVNPDAPATLLNSVEVAGDDPDPVPGNNSTSEDTTVETEADLQITKSDDPDPVAAGATLTYTLVYTNNGPSDAQNAVIVDTLDNNTTYGGVVSAPPVWGTPTYDPGPPATLTWDATTVAAGDSDAIVFTVTINADTIGAVENSVTIASETPDENLANNTDEEITDVGDPFRATIYGYVFADTNCNGVRDDDETPLPDVTISLSGPGAAQDPVMTRVDGLYYFIVETPGIYSVLEQDPNGYFSTTPNEVHLAVDLGNSYRVDFGDAQGSECAAIYGTVFEDLNLNANWDAVELGIEDVTITLNDSVVGTTDEYGIYTFSALATGPHDVVETDPEGYMSTTPNEVTVEVALGNGYEVNFGDISFCTCPADSYEEDDEWTEAVELGLGIGLSQTHDFCDDATDWTKFTARAGWIYTMTTSSWGQRADTFLYLYDTDGQTLLAASDDYEGTDDYSTRIVWQPRTSGVYYLLTTNRAGLTGCETDYDLWIEPLERGHIYLPVIMRNYRTPGGAQLEEGQALAEDTAPPYPEDLDSEVAPPEAENAVSPTGIITHVCPDAYEEDDTWELAKPIGDGDLQVHSFDSNPVVWAADKDFVTFYLEAERTITFTVPMITGTETLLELYDQNGDALNVTGTDQVVWMSPAKGHYYLSASPRLAAYGCADVAGYELKAEMSPIEKIYLPIVLRAW